MDRESVAEIIAKEDRAASIQHGWAGKGTASRLPPATGENDPTDTESGEADGRLVSYLRPGNPIIASKPSA